MRLLLVTHQPADIAVLQQYFDEEEPAYRLTTAVNLHQAQTLLSQDPDYDIILTEAELPDGLGQKLLPLAAKIPLILLTQPGTEMAVGRALAAGATAHLIKDDQQAYLHLLPALLEHAEKCNQRLLPTRGNHIQQEMQAELVANEKRLRDVLTALPDLVFRVRGDGTFLDYFTSETGRLLVPPPQFLGKPLVDVLPSPVAQQAMAHIRHTLQLEQNSAFEYNMAVGTDTEHFEARVLLYAPDEVLIVIREVTAERQAWEAVHESEQLYRQMFEMHGLPKLIVDPQTGQIVDANVAATQFYGVELAHLCTSFLSDWTDLQQDVMLDKLREAVSRNVLQWQARHKTHGRGLREVEIFSGSVKIGRNHLLYLILTDITTRVKAQNALKEAYDSLEEKVLERTTALALSEQRYRSLFNQSNDAVFLLDMAGNYLHVNQRAANMLGYQQEELIGLSLEKVVIPTEQSDSLHILDRLLAGEKIALYTRNFRHKMGHQFPVEINAELVRDTEGQPLHIQSIVRDITDRKAQERKLRYHASLQQAVTDAVIALDNQNRVQSWNSAATTLYGYTAKETLGQDVTNLLQTTYPPESLETVGATPAISIGVSEIIQRNKKGRILRILSSISPLYDEFGNREGLVAINRDITQRKEIEIALRERKELYQITIETISEGIVQQDHQGVIQLCNAAATRILGLSVMQMTGRTSLDPRWRAIREDGSPLPGEMHPPMVTLRTGKPIAGFIMGVHKPDGQLTWISVNSEPIIDLESQQVTAVVSTFTDITTQRQMIENLRQSEQRLELAAETGGIGIWDWDIQQDILLWDKRMYTLYGTVTPTHRYNDWVKTLHPDDRVQTEAAIHAAINGEEPYNCEFRIIRPDGTIRYLKGQGTVFYRANKQPHRMVGINMDITTQKQVEQTLYSALEKERELNELKSRFVSMASHEFRTPLAAILAMSETLTLYRDRMNATQVDERLEKIRHQVNHLHMIVNDVLQLERIQTGRLRLQPAHYDFDQLCRTIVAEFESQAAYQGRLRYEFASDQPGLIAFFDEQLIRQVINNLVHNGLKYSPADQLVHLYLQTTATELTLTVRDKGIGIPAKDLSRLFEPFHRAQNVGTIPGTGLGLSIAYNAVKLHQGTITVTSELRQGTTFYLTLPLVSSEENQ